MSTTVVALWKMFFISHVFAQETCRILEFVQPEKDNYLEKHFIKSFLVDNKDQCEVRCYAEDSCLSFNLGISETSGKFKCELSDSDHFQHPEHLICKEGFSYHPTMKVCGTSPCPPAASCVPDIHGKTRCVCPANWTRTESCERDEDECSSGSHGCSEEAYCNDTVGSFTCTCKAGFSGDGKECNNEDECSFGTHNCSADAYCNDTVGSFTCTCKAGFSGDGKECSNINECETGSAECHVNATCNDIIGSYICKCRDNVVGDGFLCVGFPFHFALNGSDPNISLYSGASYRNVDGRTVLYLNGTQRAYAETPALPIRAISFSIMCWIKALSSPSHPSVHHIYSDWSEPHQFRIYISESREICVNLRDPQRRDMIDYCHREIIPNKWMHVAFTWSRDRKEGILYINGIEKGRKTSSSIHSDLIKNEHKVFDIGQKRDRADNPTFNGYMRDLLVVNKALSEDEVKHLTDIL